jgi:hypothetical protein
LFIALLLRAAADHGDLNFEPTGWTYAAVVVVPTLALAALFAVMVLAITGLRRRVARYRGLEPAGRGLTQREEREWMDERKSDAVRGWLAKDPDDNQGQSETD